MSFFITCSSIQVQPSNLYHHTVYIVTFMTDARRGFGLDIGFIDHFNTEPMNTLNYSSHYLATTSEQTEDFTCAVVVVIYRV
jgi:hypothetical protein